MSYGPFADTTVGRPLTSRISRARYSVDVMIPPLRLARFLLVAVGLGLAVAGMLRLSLPLMLAGAALWLLGIASEERAVGRHAALSSAMRWSWPQTSKHRPEMLGSVTR